MIYFYHTILLAILLSCIGQGQGSFTEDASIYKERNDDINGKSLNIISTNCLTCHSQWSSYETKQDYINANLIIDKDSSQSTLIQSLKNIGGTMPPNKTLSDEDFYTLQDWVNN